MRKSRRTWRVQLMCRTVARLEWIVYAVRPDCTTFTAMMGSVGRQSSVLLPNQHWSSGTSSTATATKVIMAGTGQQKAD